MSSIAIDSRVSPDHCPWCGSVISRARFTEIETRIAEQERKRLADERSRMNREFETREAAMRKEAASQAEARAKADTDKKVAIVRAEREQDLLKIRQLEAEKQRHPKDLEEARLKVSRDFSLQLNLVREQHEKDTSQIRGALTKDRDEQLSKMRSQQGREKEHLQQKIDGLTRQLQRKTADELGEGAEVDVYDRLRDVFPYDQIERIKKGLPGADIRHQVLHKGASCGIILIDSKNRQGWQRGYVTKLREDQVAAKAEHAVLTTTVFPSGTKELCVDEETQVIVVNPARVVEIVGLLRGAVLRAHLLGLSLKQRAEKRDQLYRYITSEEYRQRLAEADRLTNEVLGLEVEEKRAHDKTWEKRGKMVTRLRNVIHEIDTEVSAVLEGRTPDSFEN